MYNLAGAGMFGFIMPNVRGNGGALLGRGRMSSLGLLVGGAEVGGSISEDGTGGIGGGMAILWNL